MADPWSLDAIVAEAEDLAYKEQAQAEAKAKAQAAAKKKSDELEARESRLRQKQEKEAAIQAEHQSTLLHSQVDAVKALEAKLYAISEEFGEAQGLRRKDLKKELRMMDSVVKKARGELSKDARRLYTRQTPADGPDLVAKLDDPDADAEAEAQAQEEMKAALAEAEKKKKKIQEDAAYAALRKKQAEEAARRKAEQDEEEAKLERLKAKYAGGGLDEVHTSLDLTLYEAPDRDDLQTADSEYTNAGDLVNEVLEKAIQKQEDDDDEEKDGMMSEMRAYKERQAKLAAEGIELGHKLREEQQKQKEPEGWLERLLLCSCAGPLKPYANRIRRNVWFDRVILLLILLNCIFLAMYNPFVPDDEGINATCSMADMAFTIIFATEMVIKWIAIGIGPYLSDGWNVLDCACVCTGLISFVPGSALGGLSGLRSARALRPLRTLNSVPGIKNLVGTIFNATHLLRDVFFLVFFLAFLFAVGKLRYYCFTPAGQATRQNCGTSEGYQCPADYECAETFRNPDFGFTNFDNTAASILSIFVVMTLDGWVDIMYKLIDTNNSGVFIYFVLVIMFLVIISLNLTAAILASRFGLIRQDMDQAALMASQAAKIDESNTGLVDIGESIEAAKARVDLKAKTTSGEVLERQKPICPCLEPLVKHYMFQNVSTVLIFAYIILLCLKTPNDSMQDIMDLLDMVFAIAFVIELIFLVLASPPSEFFSNWVNVIDSIVVVLCVVDAFIKFMSNNVGVLRLFRMARILQATKALRRFKRFWRVVGSVERTVDSAFWWNLIFFLVVFIYALLGLQLLGGRIDPKESSLKTTASEWGAIDQRASFDSFGKSFITVFVMVSGKWYYTATISGEASSFFAVIMWMTLIVIGNFILLNLLLAVLIDNIAAHASKEEKKEQEERELLIRREKKALHIHGICKRLENLGIVGKYLGEYQHDMDRLHAPLATSRPATAALAVERGTAGLYALDGMSVEDVEEEGFGGYAEGVDMPGVVMHTEGYDDEETRLDVYEEGSSAMGVGQGNGVGTRTIGTLRNACNCALPSSPVLKLRGVVGSAVGPEPDAPTEEPQRHARLAWFDNPLAGDNRADSTSGVGKGMGKGTGKGMAGKKKKKKQKQEEEEEEEPGCFDAIPIPCIPKKEKRLKKNIREEQKSGPIKKEEEVVKVELEFEEGNRSLFIFSLDNPLRTASRQLYTNRFFEWFIISLIFANCVTLAIDSPALDQESEQVKILVSIDYFFNAIFILEMVLKVIANGFVRGEHAYLQDLWNQLDFLIILISIVSMAIQNASLRALRALRAFRALRPLRLISRLKGLRVVFNTISQALPALLNVMVLAVLIWAMFGVLGLHLFCDEFHYCNDPYVSKKACQGTFTDPRTLAQTPRVWKNADFNFDNIFMATYTMFVIATLDDWQDIMWMAIDSTGKDQAPVKDNNLLVSLFFICFVVIGAFFTTSLYVGEIVNTYAKVADEEGLMLDEDAKQWAVAMTNKIELIREAESQKLKKKGAGEIESVIEGEFLPPGHGNKKKSSCSCITAIRLKFYHLVLDSKFDTFIMSIIGVNVVVMAATFYNEEKWYADLLETINAICTYVFMAEMVIKHIALGAKQYWGAVWNRLDGTIVIISIIGMVGGLGGSVSLLRALRVLRLLRLIKGVPGLKSLASTLYQSIPSLANVGIMLLLILYVYAVLGMNLFYNVKYQTHINDQAHFKTFWYALITLTRAVTFDGWRGLMTDLMVQEPNCSEAEETCGTMLSIPYFFSFILLGNFLMLNIFTAVILRNFADAAMDEGLAGEGFMTASEFKMNQLDTYIGEFQRRYRVFVQRKEKPIWLYSSTDHSVNPAYCRECGTVPCMMQSWDPVLNCMVSPHVKDPLKFAPISRASTAKAAFRGTDKHDDPNLETITNKLFDEADLEGDAILDTEEFQNAYKEWGQRHED